MTRTALALALLAAVTTAAADALPVRDLNPLLSGYEVAPALPSIASGKNLQVEYAISSTSLTQRSAQDSLQLDAEMQRWQTTFSRPLTDRLSLRLELPLISVSGGHLDHFIESFHSTFGFPNGNRDIVPRDRLLIEHEHLNQVDYRLTQSTQGIGDITLRLGHSFGANAARENILWLSVKLPTGNAGKLTGSGAADLALSLASSQQWSSRWTTHEQLSITALGHGDRLADQQQSVAWSGLLGTEARVTTHWSAAVQIDAHSKVFDTGLRVLGNALQLSLGPRYESGAWQSSLLISEDIGVDTVPDVQFQFDIGRKF
ncbi:MAG: DUF3187 family protein [Steroidobacteraceae bacterium]